MQTIVKATLVTLMGVLAIFFFSGGAHASSSPNKHLKFESKAHNHNIHRSHNETRSSRNTRRDNHSPRERSNHRSVASYHDRGDHRYCSHNRSNRSHNSSNQVGAFLGGVILGSLLDDSRSYSTNRRNHHRDDRYQRRYDDRYGDRYNSRNHYSSSRRHYNPEYVWRVNRYGDKQCYKISFYRHGKEVLAPAKSRYCRRY